MKVAGNPLVCEVYGVEEARGARNPHELTSVNGAHVQIVLISRCNWCLICCWRRAHLMTWWLSVFFLIQGQWIPGSEIDGWAPRPYASETECMERKNFAERECRDHPLDFQAVWVCTEGQPAFEPPTEEYPSMEC